MRMKKVKRLVKGREGDVRVGKVMQVRGRRQWESEVRVMILHRTPALPGVRGCRTGRGRGRR